MTIIEAIKSGRPFRRRGRSEYLLIGVDGLYPASRRLCNFIPLSEADILADDWEVKREWVKKAGWVSKRWIDSTAYVYDDGGHVGDLVFVTWEEEE